MKKHRTKTKTNSPETALISVWVPAEVARQLEATAKASDLTKSQLIRKALRKELEKQPA